MRPKNLLRGRVDEDGHVCLGALRLPVRTAFRGDVIVGIRPEAVIPGGGDGSLEFPVVLSEMLGVRRPAPPRPRRPLRGHRGHPRAGGPPLNSAPPGGVPERSKGTGCKPVGSAFAGSNPAPTIGLLRRTSAATTGLRRGIPLLKRDIDGRPRTPESRN